MADHFIPDDHPRLEEIRDMDLIDRTMTWDGDGGEPEQERRLAWQLQLIDQGHPGWGSEEEMLAEWATFKKDDRVKRGVKLTSPLFRYD